MDDPDGPSRGASTITMQVARNLLLWNGRSFIRKGLEIPLALLIDAVWTKKRVLEVYLNIAEWGDGIFGAQAAARRDFNKPASQLTAREASLLATALPNPFLRHPAKPSRGHRRTRRHQHGARAGRRALDRMPALMDLVPLRYGDVPVFAKCAST